MRLPEEAHKARPFELRIVGAAFEALGEKAHRVGDAQFYDPAADQRVLPSPVACPLPKNRGGFVAPCFWVIIGVSNDS